MDSRILTSDPEMDLQEYCHVDEAEGKLHIESVQDVTAILEANQATYADIDNRTPMSHYTRVASIPMQVYMDLHKRGIIRDRKAFKRWLNDPANRPFRTRPGRV